jgi:hypothetical protein
MPHTATHPHPSANFTLRQFYVLAATAPFTHWIYDAPNLRMHEIHAPGFFSDAEALIKPGDLLTFICAEGTGQRYFNTERELKVLLGATVTPSTKE